MRRGGQYVVPAGVHAIIVDMAGSNGGSGVLCTVVGGYGRRTTATIPVTPGEVLESNVASRLATASRVFFGTVKASRLKVVSNTKLVVRSPNHAKGVVDVRVRTLGDLSSKVEADRYTFR